MKDYAAMRQLQSAQNELHVFLPHNDFIVSGITALKMRINRSKLKEHGIDLDPRAYFKRKSPSA